MITDKEKNMFSVFHVLGAAKWKFYFKKTVPKIYY